MSNNTGNYNSFANNMQKVLKNQVNELSMLLAIQRSITAEDKSVTFQYTDDSGNTREMFLPSYTSMVNDIKRIDQTLKTLQNGTGFIYVDGEALRLQIQHLPEIPANIVVDNQNPTNFKLDSNWFFESLMFPGAVVTIDLSGKVSNNTRQVQVIRVIVNSESSAAQSLWSNYLLNNSDLTYTTLLTVLSEHEIPYSLDEQTYNLPFSHLQYTGTFTVIDDPYVENGYTWYPLDTLTYNSVSADGHIDTANQTLHKEDKIRFANALFKVGQINGNNIQLRCIQGAAYPGKNSTLNYYRDLTYDKSIDIRFGAHEYNFIFIKAVSPDYGILAEKWSNAIKFDSDSLIYDEDKSKTFDEFYKTSIADWGRSLIAESKEKWIKAYESIEPNAPVLNPDLLNVVLINVHKLKVDDTVELKQKYSTMVSAREGIFTLADSIKRNQTKLMNVSNASFADVEKEITTLNAKKAIQTKQYTTLVQELKAEIQSDVAITLSPKYRVRGEFPMPEPVYIDVYKSQEQHVIGFDIAYRYLNTSGEQTSQTVYKGTSSTGVLVEKTDKNWEYTKTATKIKIYDELTDSYIWGNDPDIETPINWIDLPITNSESIEIKVRSISEAGYPGNPVKSKWSESVIVKFPNNILTDGIENIKQNIITEEALLKAQDLIESSGINNHLEYISSNFKHSAQYIAYEDLDTKTSPISLYAKIKSLEAKVTDLETKYNSLLEQIKSNDENNEKPIYSDTSIWDHYIKAKLDERLLELAVIQKDALQLEAVASVDRTAAAASSTGLLTQP